MQQRCEEALLQGAERLHSWSGGGGDVEAFQQLHQRLQAARAPPTSEPCYRTTAVQPPLCGHKGTTVTSGRAFIQAACIVHAPACWMVL